MVKFSHLKNFVQWIITNYFCHVNTITSGLRAFSLLLYSESYPSSVSNKMYSFHYFIFNLSTSWTCGLFLALSYYKIAIQVCLQVFVWTCVLFSLGNLKKDCYILWSCMLNFKQNSQSVSKVLIQFAFSSKCLKFPAYISVHIFN